MVESCVRIVSRFRHFGFGLDSLMWAWMDEELSCDITPAKENEMRKHSST